jgi:alpha-beta hydrolase superfamily lysophospholipase
MIDPAPLVETPDAKAPPGAEAAWFTGAGGARLRAALFTPRGRARGSIVLSGGRTESIEKYYEVIGDFLDRGFVVLAHDWRGQGLSQRDLADRLKGHANGYKAFLDDFSALLDAYEARLPRPWIAVAHSMGGCLTLLALAHGEDRFAGALLSAPMLGLQTGKIPAPLAKVLASLNVLVGRGKGYTLGDPGKPFDDNFEANILTHDRVRYLRACGLVAAEPKLALGGPTWSWLDFALRATAYLDQPGHLSRITVPVVILSAELDKLIDNATHDAAARHLPQGKVITIPGAYHEILMETDPMRNLFLKAFDALTGRVAPKPAEAPRPAADATPKPAAPPAAAPPPSAAPAPVVAASTAAPAAKPPVKARAAKKPAAEKATAKKPAAARKTVAKAATVKKPAAKPATAKAPVAKKPTVKKVATAKKPVAAKAAAPKPAASKTAASKTAAPAKKPAVKKAAAKKPVARKPA